MEPWNGYAKIINTSAGITTSSSKLTVHLHSGLFSGGPILIPAMEHRVK